MDVANNYPAGTQYHDFTQSLHISYDLGGGTTLMSITSHDNFWMHDTAQSALLCEHDGFAR
jgi:hypothetical protein